MDFDQMKTPTENLMSYWLFTGAQEDKKELLNEILAKVSCKTVDFIWQQDPFNLKIGQQQRGAEEESQVVDIHHYYGCTDYGDNVGDLWFITYLLRQLTLEYDDLVIKVNDSDGEYLLIEAADYLPKWINPDTATNRVFIHQGEMHIIPLAKSPSDITPCATGTPKISTAVECVRNKSYNTRASDEIQNAISRKLKGYPALARRDIHSTTCYLPVPAAQLLQHNPQLISQATRAFYLRDPIDLKSCQHMKHFSPDNRVFSKVKMTRCIYAQLMQQKFHPPKRSSWNIPSPNNEKHKAYDLGMKIAHGFEILCIGASRDAATSDAAKSCHDENSWLHYLSALSKYNYFQGEIEGSIKYNDLMRQAKLYFESSRELQNVNNDQRGDRNQGEVIMKQLKETDVTEEQLRKSEANLAPDDDDSWLYMTYDELDNLLEGYVNTGNEETSDINFDPSQITDSMSAFISKQSSILKGAEVPNSEELKFDSKGFLSAIEKMMNGENEDPLDSDDSSLDGYESDDSLPEQPQPNLTQFSQSQAAGVQKPSAGRVTADRRSSTKKNVSFNNKPPLRQSQSKAQKDKKVAAEPEIEDFMAMMDRELSKTNIGQSFEKQSKPAQKKAAPKPPTASKASLAEEESLTDESDNDSEQEGAIDMDLNTVKNLLESYSSQMGLPGPTSNILESMGLHLPQNAD